MFDEVAKVLAADPRIAYALVFGSCARGQAHAQSDLDVAIGGLSSPFSEHDLGDLIGLLESASQQAVDLTVLDEVPPSVAYRVFRDGVVVLDRDHPALVRRRARAAMEYLDWKPVEDFFVSHSRRDHG
ncbi:MAG: nucleotidyltransferase domain-containing protein [Planctomycetota bacterium]